MPGGWATGATPHVRKLASTYFRLGRQGTIVTWLALHIPSKLIKLIKLPSKQCTLVTYLRLLFGATLAKLAIYRGRISAKIAVYRDNNMYDTALYKVLYHT